jgi:hypothetical protein
MPKAKVPTPWQHVRGQTRQWWHRLTEGDLKRSRQFVRFMGQLQARYGFSRERTAKELKRRRLKHKLNQTRREPTTPECRRLMARA